MSLLVLSLDDPRTSLELTGGKGSSLAQLVKAGLPVPSGFQVTTESYRMFVEANRLSPVIEEALDSVDPSEPTSLEDASQRVRRSFEESSMPRPVEAAIISAYGALLGANPAVAVRSSATAEDLPQASFAGQLESYLDVIGEDEVVAATKKCWGSLFTARAIGYRIRKGLGAADVSMGVVVQQMVPAEAAGILFTSNPLGDPDQSLISASWGLGDAVVGGRVTPDEYAVEKTTGRIIEEKISSKETMTVQLGGATEDRPVPRERRSKPVLNGDDLAELNELGIQIEELFGTPMDIEWALADGSFSILQARPITTTTTAQAEAVDWSVPEGGGRFMRASVVDMMPNPISPLFETMGLPIYNANLQLLLAEVARSTWKFLPDDVMRTIHHYAYMRVNYTPRQWLGLIVLAAPRIIGAVRRGPSHFRDVALPDYQAEVESLSTRSVETMSATELWENAKKLSAAATRHLSVLQVDTLGAAAGSEGLFTKVYERFHKRNEDPRAAVFLMGYDTTPAKAEKSLYDLAAWVAKSPDLAPYILETSTSQIKQACAAGGPPDDLDRVTWNDWVHELEAHQNQFGHVLYDLDFSHAIPAEDVTPLIETIRMFLRGDGRDPYERQRSLEEARVQATEALRSRTRGVRGWLVLTTLRWAQALGEVREDSIASVGLAYPRLRNALRELGSRLVAAGAIQTPDDVFWLEASEIEASLAQVDAGESLDSVSGPIVNRKKSVDRAAALTPPAQLPPSDRYMGIPIKAFIPGEGGVEGADLKGVGASPGRVTANAVVIHGPEDSDHMKQGAILVTKITTPAWTPLFTMASGIVTDIGGPLSHGSIVAREYGIPAVLGTVRATQVIQSGDEITVDGGAGLVVVHKEG